MPILTATVTIPVLASIVWTAIVAVIIRQPELSDSYAIAGAGLAAVCALIEARSKARNAWETISVFIISSVVGSCAPSIIFSILHFWGWIPAALEENMSWQWWGAAGFFCAINGWLIMHHLNLAFRRWMTARFEKRIERIRGIRP